MGDFNYPAINWETNSTKSVTSEEHHFIQCLQDNYLFQVISKPSRWRGSNIPSILDLVITKEEGRIDNIEYQSPLGKSDHCVIVFKYMCNIHVTREIKTRKSYRKANFEGMRSEIKDIEWKSILEPGTIDETWKSFCKK